MSKELEIEYLNPIYVLFFVIGTPWGLIYIYILTYMLISVIVFVFFIFFVTGTPWRLIYIYILYLYAYFCNHFCVFHKCSILISTYTVLCCYHISPQFLVILSSCIEVHFDLFDM